MKKHKLPFSSPGELQRKIQLYFKSLSTGGEQDSATLAVADVAEKKPAKPVHEPPTMAGLALFIGFDSRQAFEDYESKGRYGRMIKPARLRIEAEYEKKLHNSSSSGAIFALKSMGWADKESKEQDNAGDGIFTIQIVASGPPLADNEKDVVL